MTTESAMPTRGPLHGIRVVELATVLMGPFAGQLLADLGADVVKVETAEGDNSRSLAGGDHPQLSGLALNLHRNKRSLVLDLKSAAGGEAFRRLVGESDVLLTNVRPAALARLGLGRSDLEEAFPRLVFCEAHGFHATGPEADKPAFDDIIQALTGMPDLIGRIAGEPRFMPVLVADKVAGMSMVVAILAALVERAATGRGQSIEVPMFDAILAFNLVEHLAGATIAGGRPGYGRALTTMRGPHRTRDGWIALMPYTDQQWRRLYEAVGAEDRLTNPWHASMKTRIDQAASAYAELKEVVATRTTAEWLAIAEQTDVPAAPVVTLDDLVDDPAAHRGVIATAKHPEVGDYRYLRPAWVFSRHEAPGEPAPAPLIGEQSRSILRSLGYADADIDAFVAAGVTLEATSSPTNEGARS